ncbi:phosphatase PAP2 family protein [Vibrio sp. SCSIO 43136]|uniref:phosphatase PAP2 family protein n=1 Tax=Vibrio sp. SCSIO 43136 TaxID=2819101 RepID=UPI002075537E|nr:phosphatase PAP2 family protein [Vibrio sp. SCSIO 43136]USD67192.1 phosphatase PAP2 family protein [Vibrio sp. SCSIO 43136]
MLSWTIGNKRFEFIAIALFTLIVSVAMFFAPSPDLLIDMDPNIGVFLDIVTQSAGKTGFVITTAVLCILPLLRKFPVRYMLGYYIQFGLLLILAFGLKTGLKAITEIPRPYTQSLVELKLIDTPSEFYQIGSEDRESLLSIAETKVDPLRMKQWKGETNYSMPSGHTIFAAVCVMFWAGFWMRRQCIAITLAIIGWGFGVAYSRVWLGMHYDTDVLISLVSAVALYLIVPTIKIGQPRRKKRHPVITPS